MAKDNGSGVPAGMNVPDGYTQVKSDLTGFWNPDAGPIHITLRYAHLVDNGADKSKHSTLLIGELVADCAAMVDSDQNDTMCRKGDLVGVWYKPGMKPVLKLGGVPAYIYRDESQDVDTGKPNPMQGFAVFAKQKGQGIPIDGDYRKASLRGEKLTGETLSA